MKILVTGARGQLGRDCLAVFSRNHWVQGVDLPELDITDPDALNGVLEMVEPDVVINAAAFTQVDACENHQQEAWAANADGPRNLARSLDRFGGRLVQISTDYVFDGLRPVPEPYSETDLPNPLSQYGRSKQAGETAALEASGRHAVVRTAWLYGLFGQNFLTTMLRLATDPDRSEIRVVDDQVGSPTWSWRLALQIEKIVDRGEGGLFHATAEGHCSWYALARHFLGRMGIAHNLVPCTTGQYATAAVRPANSILENQRLKDLHIHLMRPWQEDVDRFVRAHGQGLVSDLKGKSP
jgi:dTDP-4-dehydrorhamnose reductase